MTQAKRPTLATGVYYRDPAAALKWLEQAFGFETTLLVTSPDGAIAHSGCVAFGVDLLAIALFWKHGLDVPKWPANVRGALGFG